MYSVPRSLFYDELAEMEREGKNAAAIKRMRKDVVLHLVERYDPSVVYRDWVEKRTPRKHKRSAGRSRRTPRAPARWRPGRGARACGRTSRRVL